MISLVIQVALFLQDVDLQKIHQSLRENITSVPNELRAPFED